MLRDMFRLFDEVNPPQSLCSKLGYAHFFLNCFTFQFNSYWLHRTEFLLCFLITILRLWSQTVSSCLSFCFSSMMRTALMSESTWSPYLLYADLPKLWKPWNWPSRYILFPFFQVLLNQWPCFFVNAKQRHLPQLVSEEINSYVLPFLACSVLLFLFMLRTELSSCNFNAQKAPHARMFEAHPHRCHCWRQSRNNDVLPALSFPDVWGRGGWRHHTVGAGSNTEDSFRCDSSQRVPSV